MSQPFKHEHEVPDDVLARWHRQVVAIHVHGFRTYIELGQLERDASKHQRVRILETARGRFITPIWSPL